MRTKYWDKLNWPSLFNSDCIPTCFSRCVICEEQFWKPLWLAVSVQFSVCTRTRLVGKFQLYSSLEQKRKGMEIGETNKACQDSSPTFGERGNETQENKDHGSPSYMSANSKNENTSVAKTLLRWRKCIILLLTPLLLAPLPIAVPGSVRLSVCYTNLLQNCKNSVCQYKTTKAVTAITSKCYQISQIWLHFGVLSIPFTALVYLRAWMSS